jgi:quercetin dioxygenase-like cupin family protein
MERVNESEKEFRFGNSGPKYLFRGPKIEWGIIALKPKDTLGAHYHRDTEETFYFKSGTPQIIINKQAYRVVAGDAFRIEPEEEHDIINDTDQRISILFIKALYNPEDKVSV